MSRGSNLVNSSDHPQPSTSGASLENMTPLIEKRVTTVFNPNLYNITTTSYKSRSYQMGQFHSYRDRINAQAYQQKRREGSIMSQGSNSVNSSDDPEPSTSGASVENVTPLIEECETTVLNSNLYNIIRSYKSCSYQMGQFHSYRARINAEAQQEKLKEGSAMSQASTSIND